MQRCAKGGRVAPDECVFGASPALRQALRDRPARRLGSLEATLASSTPSKLNAFCLVLFASSDPLSKALAQKGGLVLETCLKPGPAHDVARKNVRDLVLGWIQASWIRSLAIDYPNFFNVARDQKLLQNTCRVVQSAVANRTPFIILGAWISALWEHALRLLKSIQRA